MRCASRSTNASAPPTISWCCAPRPASRFRKPPTGGPNSRAATRTRGTRWSPGSTPRQSARAGAGDASAPPSNRPPTAVTQPIPAYIGVGSNLADPVRQVRAALVALGGLKQTRLLRCSSLYVSAPLGPAEQPDYINAVAAIATELDPEALLTQLQDLERAAGRIRAPDGLRWGPRVLDLDLLLYGMLRQRSATLTLPHPGIGQRAFVLRPLLEIAPDLTIPGLSPLEQLLQQCPPPAARVLDEDSH
ncbi:MAG: 2-amino-4-hydroxy-6-hydroxymethyldihydropteridine diphosphokinase [Gammaproteobacteria bacterium]|nr:2-amino-4-hydroxy-6-hydroxymethyldihydropteridine diphosphokinase [Gammaproteobacteria bacterium]